MDVLRIAKAQPRPSVESMVMRCRGKISAVRAAAFAFCLVAAVGCATPAPAAPRRSLQHGPVSATPTCRPDFRPLVADDTDVCPVPDPPEGFEPQTCVPRTLRGRQISRDDTLRMRVFQACERSRYSSAVSVSRRSVIVERMVGPGESASSAARRTLERAEGHPEFKGSFAGRDRDGEWGGWIRAGVCHFAGGLDTASPTEYCLDAQVTSEDLPAVIRALADQLAGAADACVPVILALGVPEACLLTEGPVSKR